MSDCVLTPGRRVIVRQAGKTLHGTVHGTRALGIDLGEVTIRSEGRIAHAYTMFVPWSAVQSVETDV